MSEESQGGGQPQCIKILVPTNFSRKSQLALEFALTHSQFHNAEVYLFHCLDQKSSDYRLLDKINEDTLATMKDSVMRTIKVLHDRGIHHSVDRVYRRISQGKLWTEILKITSGISADIIVMGAANESAFKKLIAKAPCTVVLVKDKDLDFVVR